VINNWQVIRRKSEEAPRSRHKRGGH
jgi:hypothetical protein